MNKLLGTVVTLLPFALLFVALGLAYGEWVVVGLAFGLAGAFAAFVAGCVVLGQKLWEAE